MHVTQPLLYDGIIVNHLQNSTDIEVMSTGTDLGFVMEAISSHTIRFSDPNPIRTQNNCKEHRLLIITELKEQR
jgi:hypothetical protein